MSILSDNAAHISLTAIYTSMTGMIVTSGAMATTIITGGNFDNVNVPLMALFGTATTMGFSMASCCITFKSKNLVRNFKTATLGIAGSTAGIVLLTSAAAHFNNITLDDALDYTQNIIHNDNKVIVLSDPALPTHP